MGCMSKKLKYQIMVFMITYLQVGVNSGYKAVVASCKSLQEMERPLQLDNQFFGWADFAFMLGLTIGAFALGHLGDYMDLRKYLLGYSLAQACSFIALGYTADSWVLSLVFKKNIKLFHLYLQGMFFLNGMFFAMCLPACTSIISSWIDIEYRGQVIAVWCSSINTGSIAFFQICFNLNNMKYNWKACYYFLGVSLIILGFITFFLLTPYPEEHGIVIHSADNHKPFQSANTVLLESHREQVISAQQLGIVQQLKMFLGVKMVQVTLLTYSIMFMTVTVLDFWLNKYLKNQGFFHSAHKISQFYELSSLFGGILVGAITDRGLKEFKFTVFAVFQLVSALALIYLQFWNTKHEYFIMMFIIGFFLGGSFNYLTGVGGKLLIEQNEVKKSGIQLTTIFAILETGGSFLSLIIFVFVPIIIDYLLITLGVLLIISSIICIPLILEEIDQYRLTKETQHAFDNLDGVLSENSNLIDNSLINKEGQEQLDRSNPRD